MPENILKAIAPAIIALLIVWLIYRIKVRVRLIVKNEIYKNFPSIKHAIENFEHRINYLNTQIEALERRIKELMKKSEE